MSQLSWGNIVEYLREKCSECFNGSKKKRENSLLSQQPIELKDKQNGFITPPRKQTSSVIPTQIPQQVEVNSSHKNRIQSKITIANQQLPHHVSNSETKLNNNQHIRDISQQFQSIDSYYSKQTESRARRSFKMVNSLKKSESAKSATMKEIGSSKLSTSFIKRESKFKDYQLTPQNSQKCIQIIDEAEKLRDWMHKEYGQQKKAGNFRISYAIRLRMQGQTMLTLLLHKLQDFRIFYLEESRTATHSFQNKSKTLKADFVIGDIGASTYKTGKVMAFYRIQCPTLQVDKILQLLATRQALKILHNFNQVSLIDRQLSCPGQFPYLQAQQVDRRLKRCTTYHIAQQLGQVQFLDEQGRQLVEASFSLDQGQSSWQRIVKIFLSQKGHIQIYCESSQQILDGDASFFSMKWTSLQRYLVNLKLIPHG